MTQETERRLMLTPLDVQILYRVIGSMKIKRGSPLTVLEEGLGNLEFDEDAVFEGSIEKVLSLPMSCEQVSEISKHLERMDSLDLDAFTRKFFTRNQTTVKNIINRLEYVEKGTCPVKTRKSRLMKDHWRKKK